MLYPKFWRELFTKTLLISLSSLLLFISFGFLRGRSTLHCNEAAVDYKYCINGKLITSNSSQKDLGVIISSDYQCGQIDDFRLIHLWLLPLMTEFEIIDILFMVKSIKYPSNHFDIHNYIQFSNHTTRSSSYFKLKHALSRNTTQSNFYFNR